MLLHLVAQVDKAVPVIFVNTQKMFGETLAYRDELAEKLGLTDLRVVRPDPFRLAARDATGLRWSFDPDGCCEIRKVEPLRRALGGFDAWLSGRKGFQAPHPERTCRASRSTRASSRSIRSPTGTGRGSTPISPPTICRATRSKPKASPRSAACRARRRSGPARTRAPGAGAAGTRRNAASTPPGTGARPGVLGDARRRRRRGRATATRRPSRV